jgi:serine/threonine protein kinase
MSSTSESDSDVDVPDVEFTLERAKDGLPAGEYTQIAILGAGTDGTVYSYQHDDTKQLIAVKVAADEDDVTYEMLFKEIENFKKLRRHDHVVRMLSFNTEDSSIPTGIYLEHCDLGNLNCYRKKWCDQEGAQKRPRCVSEATIWKLLKDISLGLDFMHNQHYKSYVHNDLKPSNILVCAPKNWSETHGVPEKPIFKLADFSRLVRFPTPEGCKPQKWMGTPEYAPPLKEQKAPVQPSVDMWSLGATIQYFALGIHPVESKKTFLQNEAWRRLLGEDVPHFESWNRSKTRNRRQTVYRPLNSSEQYLVANYDLDQRLGDYKTYTYMLNNWYSALWRRDPAERVTAAELVKYVVPRKNWGGDSASDSAIEHKMTEKGILFEKAEMKIRENLSAKRKQKKLQMQKQKQKQKKKSEQI